MAIIKGKNPRKPYTVRYRDVAGKQREASFTTRKEAEKFQTDQERAKRYGNDVNVKAGKELFNDLAENYLRHLPVRTERTRDTYLGAFRKHVKPAYAGKTILEASQDRGLAEELLNVTMLHMSIGPRRQARMIITGALDSAVAAGKIESHRLAGIKFAERTVTETTYTREEKSEGAGEGFIHLTDGQVAERMLAQAKDELAVRVLTTH